MHWTEFSARELRRRMEIVSFVSDRDAERLLEYHVTAGLDCREEAGLDRLGEICSFRQGRWKMKIRAGLKPAERARIILHELGHMHTSSGMPGCCPPSFHWWWLRRDEINSRMWEAHLRLPSELLIPLMLKGAGWNDLLSETRSPAPLLRMKLEMLQLEERLQIPTSESQPACPILASETFAFGLRSINSWQSCLLVAKPSTGEIWAAHYAHSRALLREKMEELAWDRMSRSPRQFWSRWRKLLKPLPSK